MPTPEGRPRLAAPRLAILGAPLPSPVLPASPGTWLACLYDVLAFLGAVPVEEPLPAVKTRLISASHLPAACASSACERLSTR
jgi:hypothetical protein